MSEMKFSSTEFFAGFKDRGMDISVLGDMPWPSVKDEAWRHTSLDELSKNSFKIPINFDRGLLSKAGQWLLPDAINIVFIDGIFVDEIAELYKLPDSVKVKTGENAFFELEKSGSDLSRHTKNDASLFMALNRARFREALFIEVVKEASLEKPIHLVYLLSGTHEMAAFFPRIFVKVRERAKLAILETTVALNDVRYFNSPVAEIVMRDGASVEWIRSYEHSGQGFHVGTARVWQGQDSSLRTFMFTKGARLFRDDLSVVLEGEGAETSVNGLHLVKGEAHADSHTFVEHVAANTKSDQLYKCVLQDKAHSVFNGRIFVGHEAQKTNSYQLNKNLLMSRECSVNTKPQLEINADDVKCSHGATIGQLSDEQLFYLETRGISGDEATKILVRGFQDDVLNKINHPLIRAAVAKRVG